MLNLFAIEDDLWNHIKLCATMTGVTPQAYMAYMAYLIVKDMTTIELILDRNVVQAVYETANRQKRTVNQVLVEIINERVK